MTFDQFVTHSEQAEAYRSAADAAREARRAIRLGSLADMRQLILAGAADLGRYIAGEASESACAALDRIPDPCLSMTRMARALRQVVALEEKLDEDDETRLQRQREEALAWQKEIAAEEADRVSAAEKEQVNEARRYVRRAVRDAQLDADPDMSRGDRERLLDDLFEGYEDYDDYSGDLNQIVVNLCRQIGIPVTFVPDEDPDDGLDSDDDLPDDEAEPRSIEAAGPARAKAPKKSGSAERAGPDRSHSVNGAQGPTKSPDRRRRHPP
jgi:hypothetical protein